METNYLDHQVFDKYGRVNLERLTGKRGAKESSKAAVKRIKNMFKNDHFSIIEVGCSAGHIVRPLDEAFPSGVSYVGMDIDENAINLGNGYLANNKILDSSKLVLGEIEQIPFPDKSFDLALSINVLEHLRHPEKALSELLRVSKKGVIIRCLVAETSWIIKEAKNSSHVDFVRGDASLPALGAEIDRSGEPVSPVYHNVWGESFLRRLIKKMSFEAVVSIDLDTDFDANLLNEDTATSGLHLATRVIAGRQTEGFFMPPHSWVVCTLPSAE